MIRTLLVVGLVLALAGCSTTPPVDEAVVTDQPTDPATPASTGLPAFDSVCDDPAGDADAAGGDLTQVELVSDSELLFVTFRLAEPLGVADLPDSQFQVLAYDQTGNNGYIWGVQFIGGNAHIFQASGGQQTNLDNGFLFDQGQVAIRFPVTEIAGFSGGMNWRATSSVGTLDSDTCGTPEMITVLP